LTDTSVVSSCAVRQDFVRASANEAFIEFI
jgi:hypothetical protein